MNNPVSNRRNLSTSVVCLLAFASSLAAQESQSALEQRIADLERRLGASPQGESSSSTGSSLLDMFKNGEARYVPGRGLTFSAQDAEKFSINLGGQVQVGYGWSEDDVANVSNSGFSVDSARIRLGGNVYSKDVTYFVQMDPSAGNDLVDAWAGWRVHESINIRVGQQKMRSGLQADTSMNDTDLELVDRSLATTTFANQRATGALVEGNLMEGKLNWHAGLMNNGTGGLDGGNPNQQAGTDTLGWTVGASFGSDAGNSETWSEGDLAHAGKAQWIAGATLTSTNEAIADGGDAMTINLFGGLKLGNGLAAQAEYWMRDNDDLNRDDAGYYGQLSYTLKKTGKVQWGGVLRYGMVDLDGPETTEIAAGINAYYSEHNLKTQVQVRSVQADNAAGVEVSDTTSIDVLFTLVF